METKPYIPISCNFYDRLEAWSVTKEPVKIKLFEQDETVNGLIIDLFIRDKVEFLKLDTQQEVRLDYMESVNGIPVGDNCNI